MNYDLLSWLREISAGVIRSFLMHITIQLAYTTFGRCLPGKYMCSKIRLKLLFSFVHHNGGNRTT